MSTFETDGSWSVSFTGAGFLAIYHVGVCQCLRERAPRILQGARRLYGSSSGALSALAFTCGKSVDFCCFHLLGMVKVIHQLSLGIFHPAFAPIEFIAKELHATLPANAHILASGKLGISVTRWSDGQNVIFSDFATRNELIQALVCTTYVPFYCGVIPPEFRGERYVDGGLSNNVPFEDAKSTITVSPFCGTYDICPQSTSASFLEMNLSNTSIRLSTSNFSMLMCSLFPPSPETLADLGRQGYLDAMRFLERRGLTKEPILWVLALKEPPASAEGAQDEGCDHDTKADLVFNWTVPNVSVKDVPNFEMLTPEMEAALRKACVRKSSAWARFWRSGPGQVLTYLLLPWTLPLEYVYFRSRRVMLWLPDAPADLRWIHGLLTSSALKLYWRTKAQLLGTASPPPTTSLAANPLDPKQATPED
ncbi:PREDICTED: patatin-like phospholipase domain-containing protein 5 [Elephantulus edwardii]|uniref:patatin-like phospholipase domain-containing protein 5 n=1 Tax=Elephantulus edwardii TaxID=28737 RepID=UPI0003F0A9CC|nr:PREDICTED: patatin-like phospholipase domain-containing protein 5 [Elephantulus edwardii]